MHLDIHTKWQWVGLLLFFKNLRKDSYEVNKASNIHSVIVDGFTKFPSYNINIRFQSRWFFLQFGNITLLASLHLHTIIEKPRYTEGLQGGVL